MKRFVITIAAVALATAAQAKEAKFYQKGRIQQMDSVSCGYAENSSKTIMGEIVGTDGAHKKTKEMLCQEYVLKADRVLYRIRPKEEKHPVLLPVGEDAEFRIKSDKLILRVNELDGKEREYSVVSMTPIDKSDASGK
jgi:hypothetical protein